MTPTGHFACFRSGYGARGGAVACDKLVSPLIEAVKTLKAENEKLKQDNEDIKKQLAEILSLLKDQ